MVERSSKSSKTPYPGKVPARAASRTDERNGAIASLVVAVDETADEALRVLAVARAMSLFCENTAVS